VYALIYDLSRSAVATTAPLFLDTLNPVVWSIKFHILIYVNFNVKGTCDETNLHDITSSIIIISNLLNKGRYRCYIWSLTHRTKWRKKNGAWSTGNWIKSHSYNIFVFEILTEVTMKSSLL
jgi:hypothetical protein